MSDEKDFIRRIVLQLLETRRKELVDYDLLPEIEGLKRRMLLDRITDPLLDICKRYRGVVFEYKTEQPKCPDDIDVVLSENHKEKLLPTVERKQEQSTLEKIAERLESVDKNLYKILLYCYTPENVKHDWQPKSEYSKKEIFDYYKTKNEITKELASDCVNRTRDD